MCHNTQINVIQYNDIDRPIKHTTLNNFKLTMMSLGKMPLCISTNATYSGEEIYHGAMTRSITTFGITTHSMTIKTVLSINAGIVPLNIMTSAISLDEQICQITITLSITTFSILALSITIKTCYTAIMRALCHSV